MKVTIAEIKNSDKENMKRKTIAITASERKMLSGDLGSKPK